LAACGVEVTVRDNQVLKISADKQNPHSWNDFCAKGRTANKLVEHPRRILNPMRRVGDSCVEATWDEAISDIATRMNALIEADGPDAVAAYWGNPAGYSSSNVMFMTAWLDAMGPVRDWSSSTTAGVRGSSTRAVAKSRSPTASTATCSSTERSRTRSPSSPP
jgi:anaerobic selenocysteine-containing dehydrogenase